MPFAPEPLPRSLNGRIFTTAESRAAGVPADRLRDLDLDASVYGVRAPRGSSDSLRERCRMFAARLPAESFISHSTSARLMGAPLPRRFEGMTTIHVTVEAPARAPHASQINGHSRQVTPGDVVVGADGVRHSSPERMVCEMARVLDIQDLVAVIDFLIGTRMPQTTISALAERVDVRDRLARSSRLLPALELADPRSESPQESRLRVILTLAGIPPARINHEVVQTQTGARYRIDLAFPDAKVALEYQGDYHRTREQWRRDMTRRSRLEADGWYVMEINADDLRDPAELVARIRQVLSARRQTMPFARLGALRR